MEMVDTHAHIYKKEFKDDIAQVIERSLEHHVKKIYLPNIDTDSIEEMLALEAQYSAICAAMMGIHPCAINDTFEKQLYQVEAWLAKRKFVAVGEVGIDLYWDTTYQAQQKEAFAIQLEWAKQYEIPVVIHCRGSFQETIHLVEKHKDERLKGIFHCFNGKLDEAKHIIELGFYIGIGGIVTFKNGGLDKVLPSIELKHIVLETDSPYLAPVPYRG
ncbi:MAG: TatD family hydrolase, partial [Cytophagales bacterium]|nr:TatD family hydrolase [Cytophagales bacterium]